MTCEKCKNQEAVFHLKSVINGHSTEKHLCSACADKEGIRNIFSMRNAYNHFFAPPFSGVFENFLAPRAGAHGYGYLPAVLIPVFQAPQTEVSVEGKEESEKKIPAGVDEDARRQRELNALKYQLQAAVQAEEFEKAAELRDQIHTFETGDK